MTFISYAQKPEPNASVWKLYNNEETRQIYYNLYVVSYAECGDPDENNQENLECFMDELNLQAESYFFLVDYIIPSLKGNEPLQKWLVDVSAKWRYENDNIIYFDYFEIVAAYWVKINSKKVNLYDVPPNPSNLNKA